MGGWVGTDRRHGSNVPRSWQDFLLLGLLVSFCRARVAMALFGRWDALTQFLDIGAIKDHFFGANRSLGSFH